MKKIYLLCLTIFLISLSSCKLRSDNQLESNNSEENTTTPKEVSKTNTAPIFTSAPTIRVFEKQTNALTLVAKDADNNPLTYSINGKDADKFNIDSSTGVIEFINAPEYEITKTSYSFTAKVTDGIDNDTQNITIHIKLTIFKPANRAELKDKIDKYTANPNPILQMEIEKADTSLVTDMKTLFTKQNKFNLDISKWDTSKVKNMRMMFHRATEFNQDISEWNTSMVENMKGMFKHATAFNQNISKWDTSKVKNMKIMFKYAKAFNQDISEWNVEKVTKNTNFDEEANTNWDTSKQPQW